MPEKVVYWVFLLGVPLLFAADVLTDFEPAKLTVLFVMLAWFPLLALHESGHALMAAALGWRVNRVAIGMGPLVAQFRLGGVPVELRAFPLEGFVEPAPRKLHWPRLKSALIYAAGPGIELLLAVLLFWFIGWDGMLSSSLRIPVMAAQSVSLVVAFSMFVNLVPHRAHLHDGQIVANDGLGIIRSFTLPDEYFAVPDGGRTT